MFLDTSGLMCVFDSRDFRHIDAVAFYEAANRLLTSNYVIAEFVALAEARNMPRRAALEFIADLLNDTEIEVIWVDELQTQEALFLLQKFDDKTWSLCDAVSFLLMQENGITEALTTDHHFEQAGFVKLLES